MGSVQGYDILQVSLICLYPYIFYQTLLSLIMYKCLCTIFPKEYSEPSIICLDDKHLKCLFYSYVQFCLFCRSMLFNECLLGFYLLLYLFQIPLMKHIQSMQRSQSELKLMLPLHQLSVFALCLVWPPFFADSDITGNRKHFNF